MEAETKSSKELQVTAHLTFPERKAFDEYSREFLLDAAGLLALLFAREKRFGRLRELICKDVPPDGPRKTKVTFRARTEEEHDEVMTLAKEAGASLSHAGAVLLRAELKERWLARALTTRFESPHTR